MDGSEKPEYGQCVDIVTRSAQREMIIPSLIPIVFTVIVGVLSSAARIPLPGSTIFATVASSSLT
jgi:K(+)-stimulated pyrophosphate-energized sodium pump